MELLLLIVLLYVFMRPRLPSVVFCVLCSVLTCSFAFCLFVLVVS